MTKAMLTEDEIRKIKEGAVIITLESAMQAVATRRIKVIHPTLLNNGYKVGYSIEIELLEPGFEIHHISVSNSKGITDPADAECIARDFLGDGYKVLGSMHVKNVIHFIKSVKKEQPE